MRTFDGEASGQRVLLGAGTLGRIADEVDRLGDGAPARVALLTTPGRAELAARVADLLGERVVVRFDGAVMHTPVEVTDRAEAVVRAAGATVVVSLGGGSVTGLGKALSVRLGVPQLAVPTTYAGSECTPVLGETADGRKTTRRAPEVLPEAILYDVTLTTSLPWATTLTSAVNAVAHAVEALYAEDRTEATDALAVEALGALRAGLATREPDLPARGELLFGAWLAGRCLATVGMGLHHQLCHTLGGSFGLPHAPTHTVVLPHVMAFNAPAAPEATALAEDALSVGAGGLQGLIGELGGPTDLAGLGFSVDDGQRAADLVASKPYPNPREVTREGIVDLLSRATAGTPIGDP